MEKAKIISLEEFRRTCKAVGHGENRERGPATDTSGGVSEWACAEFLDRNLKIRFW